MVKMSAIHPSYQERSFSLHHAKDNPGVDYLRHPSGVIVLLLSADHEVFKHGIQEVSFTISSRKNRDRDISKQTVTGKSKKGGLKLAPSTKICLIKCADGNIHTVRAGVKGTLIEVNARLVERPQLLTESRHYAGYLAIMIPPPNDFNSRNRVPIELGNPLRVALELIELSDVFAQTDNNNDMESTEQGNVIKEKTNDTMEKAFDF